MTYNQLIAYIDGLNADGSLSSADYQAIINYILAGGDLENAPRDLIQVRRGNEADLPSLAQGELAFTLDTENLWVGGINGNKRFMVGNYVDVKDFGAKGNNINDDTTAIINAIAYAVSKNIKTVLLSEGVYKISSTIDIPAGIVLSGYGSKLVNKTIQTPMLSLSSDAKVLGVEMEGVNHTVINNDGVAIKIQGTSLQNIKNVLIKDCKIYNFAIYGVYGKYAKNVIVEGCEIRLVGYTGVMFITSELIRVLSCNIGDITTGISGDAYGVSFTSVAGEPQIKDCVVSNCYVENIPTWKGLDTHGGINIKFIGNIVRNTKQGIGVVAGDSASSGCHNCLVDGNTIYGSGLGYGIGVAGVSAFPTFNTVVANNNLINCGKQGDSIDGGIYCNNTENTNISNNILYQCYAQGINLYTFNDNFLVVGNTVIDVQDNTYTAPSCVAVRGSDNKGLISDNVLRRENVGLNTYVSVNGVLVSVATNNDLTIGVNRITAVNAFNGGEGQTRKFAQFGNDVHTFVGFGSPEGVVTAGVGSTFINLNGATNTTRYLKENGVGNTGWVAK